MKRPSEGYTSHQDKYVDEAIHSTNLEFKAAVISHYLNQDESSHGKKSAHHASKYRSSLIFSYDDGQPIEPKFDSKSVGEVDKDTYPNLVIEVLKSVEKPHEQQDFLIAIIKLAYKHPNSVKYIEKIGDVIGPDRIRAAEITLEATKEINLRDKHYAHSKGAIEKLYNDKVRGVEGQETKLEGFDELMKVMHPEEFGKMLFSEEKKNDKHRLPAGLSDHHLKEFKDAATALKDHAERSRHILSPKEKSTAVDNLLSNLSREQMAYVIKAVKSGEDFDKKDWLSKTLSNFVESIQKLFSKKISSEVVKAGIEQILRKGAKIQESNIEAFTVKEKQKDMGRSK